MAAAAAEREFLAFRKGLAPDVQGEYTPPQVDGTIQRYASLVAERLVLQNGLQRPRSWPGAQRDLQALDAIRGGHPEMAATYLVGDNMGIGPAAPDGWSVFYIADYEQRQGYTPVYTEVRDYDQHGQGRAQGGGPPELERGGRVGDPGAGVRAARVVVRGRFARPRHLAQGVGGRPLP